MKKLIYTLLVCLCYTLSGAQNSQLSEDLATINHTYFDLHKKVAVKATATQGENVVTTNYVAYMDDIDHYYMVSEGTEMLISSSVKIALNKATNSVMIDSNGLNSTDELPFELFDTITQLYSSKEHYNLKNGIERYVLVPALTGVRKIVIDFERKTMLLNRVQLVSEGSNGTTTSLDIYYSYEPLNDTDIPAISKFLVFDKEGEASLTPEFNQYRLINFLNR
ncbi:MAG: hypothetical protein JJ975_04145 [Bacteroidia bacterium]|nr:hypothetical protein [Bacteroidia bacterium]